MNYKYEASNRIGANFLVTVGWGWEVAVVWLTALGGVVE